MNHQKLYTSNNKLIHIPTKMTNKLPIDHRQKANTKKQQGGKMEKQSSKLWKEVTRKGFTDINQDVKKSGLEDGKEEQFLHLENQKPKVTRISNFLKQLQVQRKSENEHRFGSDSQIISILDIKYCEQTNQSVLRKENENRVIGAEGFILSTNNLNESQIINEKVQISILFEVLKQLHDRMREQLASMCLKTSHQLRSFSQSVNNMVKHYEAEILQKNLQIRQLQLSIKEVKLSNKEILHTLQIQRNHEKQKFKNVQSKNEKLQQNVNHFVDKVRQMDDSIKLQKKYNKELNEMVLHLCSRVQQLEQKKKCMERQHNFDVSSQISQVSQKYQEIIKQKQRNFELKLENNRISIMNMMGECEMKKMFTSQSSQSFKNINKLMMESKNTRKIHLRRSSYQSLQKESADESHSENENSETYLETDPKISQQITLSHTDSSHSPKSSSNKKFSRTNKNNQSLGSSFIIKKGNNEKKQDKNFSSLALSVSSINLCQGRSEQKVIDEEHEQNYQQREEKELEAFDGIINLKTLGISHQCVGLNDVKNIKKSFFRNMVKLDRKTRETII